MKKIFLSFFILGAVGFGFSQVKTPQASPSSTLKQTIGLSEVSVEYSRPSAKNRKIFGALVPFGKVWRTGANGSTDITFGSDVTFGGVAVPAGKYALYSMPAMGSWEVILYKDTEQWGAPEKLDDSQIIAKVKANPTTLASYTETFAIGFEDLKSNGANLTMTWENTQVKVPVLVDSTKEIIASINTTLSSPSAKARDFHQAADYYLSEGLDAKKALEWSKKANEMSPDTFYMLKLRAEAEAATGNKKAAIATAKKSMELAKKAKNKDYVDMNTANIAKWSK